MSLSRSRHAWSCRAMPLGLQSFRPFPAGQSVASFSAIGASRQPEPQPSQATHSRSQSLSRRPARCTSTCPFPACASHPSLPSCILLRLFTTRICRASSVYCVCCCPDCSFPPNIPTSPEPEPPCTTRPTFTHCPPFSHGLIAYRSTSPLLPSIRHANTHHADTTSLTTSPPPDPLPGRR